MTDLELLFLVLVVIYLWECAWWARRGTVGFRTWLGKNWRFTPPPQWLGNQNGGVIFSHPLPPLGYLLASQGMPVSVSPDAVLAYQPPSVDPARRWRHNESLFQFDQIQRVEAKGKRILIDGQLLTTAGSTIGAVELAAKLRELRQAAPGARRHLIERAIGAMFDTSLIRQRWTQFHTRTQPMRLTANMLFFYLFALTPLALWRFGLSLTWIWLLAGMLGCTLTIAMQFRRTHQHLYPAAEDERFTHFIILLLSPASAVRALDPLARPLLEPFHPLAVAKVLCSEQMFRCLAQQFLRELRYPALPLSPRPELTQSTERYARELLLSRIEKLIRQNGWSPEDLLQPPPRTDQSCLSFCPRCQATFTLAEGVCQDCGGVPLISFEAGVRRAGGKPPLNHPVGRSQGPS